VVVCCWEIQTYLHSTSLPQGCLHKVWHVLVLRVDDFKNNGCGADTVVVVFFFPAVFLGFSARNLTVTHLFCMNHEHCHQKGCLFILEVTSNSTLERYLKKNETASHVLCGCEALPNLRVHHLGCYFMEPGDCLDSLSKVLHIIQRVGLLGS
jgi:hypothetical protein